MSIIASFWVKRLVLLCNPYKPLLMRDKMGGGIVGGLRSLRRIGYQFFSKIFVSFSGWDRKEIEMIDRDEG